MVQAVYECRHSMDKARSKRNVNTMYALEKYWNHGKHAYCAWKMFPGNQDIYYDDNAHAAQALLTAYSRYIQDNYREKAKEILEELIIPASQQDGGVPWHISNPSCRNACSTGPAAVAALRIFVSQKRWSNVVNKHFLEFGKRALKWMVENLRDPEDGLIWDSFIIEGDGNHNINKTKWTYNTGFAIHGFTLLYEITKKEEHLNTAIEFAEAAMNRDGAFFDKSIPDPKERMYSDASYFLHHLVDGYAELATHATQELRDRLHSEIRHIAQWGRDWILDPTDKLYFRGSCPYTISEELTKKFNEKFGLEKVFEANSQERDEKGDLCKTLLGNAGWARILHAVERLG